MRKLFAVNVEGTWLFANSVARHLMERKAKGSMVFIGSMSGAIVNVPQPQACVFIFQPPGYRSFPANLYSLLKSIQRRQSCRPPHGCVSGCRVGSRWHPRQLHLPWLHADLAVSFFCTKSPFQLEAQVLTLDQYTAPRRSWTRTRSSRSSGPPSSPRARWASPPT